MCAVACVEQRAADRVTAGSGSEPLFFPLEEKWGHEGPQGDCGVSCFRIHQDSEELPNERL